MLKSDDALTVKDLVPAPRAAVRAERPEDRAPGEALEPGAGHARSSPCAGNTPPAAGPSGPRASSSAPPSCSSTPPARTASWRSAAAPPSSAWPRTSPTSGVHDHGFNNVSTYGNLLRLKREGRIPDDAWERRFYELALKVTGAVQAARLTRISPELGYIYSFNGPHSLFADTIRSLRALAVSHQLGHVLMGEGDKPISAAGPAAPARARRPPASTSTSAPAATPTTCAGGWPTSRSSTSTTAPTAAPPASRVIRPSPPGRAGWPGWSAATRSSWSSCRPCRPRRSPAWVTRTRCWLDSWRRPRRRPTSTSPDSCTDGIPYWDTGAPGLAQLGDYLGRAADPFNEHEPVDSSAAAIAAQGLIRLGNYLVGARRRPSKRRRYLQAGLTVARTLFAEPYLSTDPAHEGLLLHSVYHRPNGWDHVRRGTQVPCGRVVDVGRLPRARAGPAAAAPGRRQAVPEVLSRLRAPGGGRISSAAAGQRGSPPPAHGFLCTRISTGFT